MGIEARLRWWECCLDFDGQNMPRAAALYFCLVCYEDKHRQYKAIESGHTRSSNVTKSGSAAAWRYFGLTSACYLQRCPAPLF
jgi:hypothetical protein